MLWMKRVFEKSSISAWWFQAFARSKDKLYNITVDHPYSQSYSTTVTWPIRFQIEMDPVSFLHAWLLCNNLKYPDYEFEELGKSGPWRCRVTLGDFLIKQGDGDHKGKAKEMAVIELLRALRMATNEEIKNIQPDSHHVSFLFVGWKFWPSVFWHWFLCDSLLIVTNHKFSLFSLGRASSNGCKGTRGAAISYQWLRLVMWKVEDQSMDSPAC